MSDAAQFHINQGIAKAERGNFAGALLDFEQAIELEPGNGAAYFLRGVAELNLKDFVAALSDLDQAIALDPDDPNFYQPRGAAKFALHDYAGAVVELDHAIALDPDDPDLYEFRADAKYFLRDYAGAIVDYGQAIKRDPDNTQARRNLDRAKAALEDLAETEIAPQENDAISEPEPPSPEPTASVQEVTERPRIRVSTREYEEEAAPEIIDLDIPPEPDNPLAPNIQPEPETPPEPPASQSAPAKKSKVAAALLAFLLGGFGAHKFYLGYPGPGLIHLLLSLTIIGALVNVPICVIEFLIYLSKSDEEFHQTYVVNRRRFF